jgi:hypothetical protein
MENFLIKYGPNTSSGRYLFPQDLRPLSSSLLVVWMVWAYCCNYGGNRRVIRSWEFQEATKIR